MFARVALRSAMRAPTARPLAAAAATGLKVGATKVALSTSASRKTPPEVIQERHVPVTHWEGGVAAHEVLNVSDKDQPVNPAQQDEEVVAKPLDPEVTAKLTPTMSKFTLHGKVAVVTG